MVVFTILKHAYDRLFAIIIIGPVCAPVAKLIAGKIELSLAVAYYLYTQCSRYDILTQQQHVQEELEMMQLRIAK